MPPLSKWRFSDGFIAAANFIMQGLDALVEGSRNFLLLGAVVVNGQLVPASMRPWKGLQSKGASTGARKLVQVGKTWGGIKDIGGTQGSGSFFEDFGRSLWMIGAGQPSIEGADLTGITLSTNLKVAIAVAGVYSAANTFTAGLAQPSSPDVGIVATPGAGFSGLVKGAISVKIARFRSSTGGRSRASTTSAVIEPNNQTFRITFPAAASGQDYWRVFVTQQGFGGVGLHLALPYNGSYDISEAAVAAGTVDGVARSLEFEYKDGDLAGGDIAWVDDFTPPAGTHAARVGTCMNVLGAYGDSSTSVSSTSTGTVGACSLPNFYESYVPSHLLYFPEQVVDCIGREWDDHSFVIHKGAVTSIQFVGLRDGPACAVETVWSDVGFQYAGNCCQFFGRLFGIVAQGSLVIMDEQGNPNFDIGAPIRDAIKDWLPEDTRVGFAPDSLSLVVTNGGVAYSYSLENHKWSPPEYFTDAGVSGAALSCIASQGRMIVSVNNAGAHTAYTWDAGATSMPVTAVSNWKSTDAPVDIHQIAASFDCDSFAQPLVIGVHANMRRTHARDFATTNGSNVVTSATFAFDAEHTGDVVCLFGTNIGGAGVHRLIARLTYASATTATMTDPATGATLNAQATLAGLYGVVAHDLSAYLFTRAAPQHTGALPDFLARDLLTHAVSLSLVTSATRGQILEVAAYDEAGGESVTRTV
jgi:hypothetical protein